VRVRSSVRVRLVRRLVLEPVATIGEDGQEFDDERRPRQSLFRDRHGCNRLEQAISRKGHA
jgi:hypothetical protein